MKGHETKLVHFRDGDLPSYKVACGLAVDDVPVTSGDWREFCDPAPRVRENRCGDCQEALRKREKVPPFYTPQYQDPALAAAAMVADMAKETTPVPTSPYPDGKRPLIEIAERYRQERDKLARLTDEFMAAREAADKAASKRMQAEADMTACERGIEKIKNDLLLIAGISDEEAASRWNSRGAGLPKPPETLLNSDAARERFYGLRIVNPCACVHAPEQHSSEKDTGKMGTSPCCGVFDCPCRASREAMLRYAEATRGGKKGDKR